MRVRLIVLLCMFWSLAVAPAMADVIIRGRTVTKPDPGEAKAQAHAAGVVKSIAAKYGLLESENGAGVAIHKLLEQMAPKVSTDDFVIYISGDRMRMDSGQQTMYLTRIPKTGQYAIAMIDRAQKVVISMALGVAAIADWATVSNATSVRIDDVGAGPRLLGHDTRRLTYNYSTTSTPQLRAAGFHPMVPPDSVGTPLFSASTGRKGEMIVAPDMPGRDEVQSFYRVLSSVFGELEKGGFMTGDLLRNMAAMTSHGMPLEVSEESVVTVAVMDATAKDEKGLGLTTRLGRTLTTTTVSSVEVGPVDPKIVEPSLPAGFQVMSLGGSPPAVPGPPGASPGCDCSCSGFQDYMALAKNRTDPQAQSKLMAQAKCATQCMSKWTGCRRPN